MEFFLAVFVLSLIFIPFVLPVMLLVKYNALKNDFERYKLKFNILEKEFLGDKKEEPIKVVQEIKPSEVIISEPPLENKTVEFKKDEKIKHNSSFENIFLGNLFNKIGAVVLVFAICMFVKTVSPLITPLGQIIISFLVSCGFILGSLHLHKKEMKNYAQVLCGVGIAGCLITTYAGCSFYDVIPITLASVIGFSVVALSYYIAHKFNTFSTLLIGLLGGYLNPFLINHCVETSFLFSYLIFMNLITIAYVNRNTNKIFLNFLNIFATLLTVTIFSFDKEILIIYPLILWAVYFFNDVYLVFKDKYNESFKALSWVNFLVLLMLTINVFKIDSQTQIGLTLLCCGVVYLIAQYFIAKFEKQNKVQLQNALLAVLFATYFLANEISRPCFWALEALILGYLYAKTNYKEIKNYPLTFVFASVVSVFFANETLYSINADLFINQRLLLFGLPSLFIYLLSLVADKKETAQIYFCKLISLTFIYLYLVFETSNVIIVDAAKYYIGIILAALYSINTRRIYEALNSKMFLFSSYLSFFVGLVLLIITAFEVTTYLKCESCLSIFNLSFLACAMLILASVYLFKKSKKNIFEYIAIFIGTILILGEVNILIAKEFLVDESIIYSIALILYAGVIMLFGIFKNIKAFKISGIWLSLLLIIKIIFFDLIDIDPILKLIAFTILGACLMLASYYYSKNKKG